MVQQQPRSPGWKAQKQHCPMHLALKDPPRLPLVCIVPLAFNRGGPGHRSVGTGSESRVLGSSVNDDPRSHEIGGVRWGTGTAVHRRACPSLTDAMADVQRLVISALQGLHLPAGMVIGSLRSYLTLGEPRGIQGELARPQRRWKSCP